ncbi:MAG: P1 family peptidase, partial [Candidatus Sulfotelmatobacter sp.]
MIRGFFWFVALMYIAASPLYAQTETRPRARDLGIRVGVLPPGPLNAITDVAGVKVGQTTLIRGDNIRTGVTAIVPQGGNLYKDRVPAAVFLGNAYGKLTGSTQVNEMGEIETPILLTGTDSVFRASDALVTYMFNIKGNENVLSVNPIVGETNDGWLSDIRSRPIAPEDVFKAIDGATSGPVEEGVVGAGTGTIAFRWKGGDWNVVAAAAGFARRLYRGRFSADKFWRESDYCGCPDRKRVGGSLSHSFRL